MNKKIFTLLATSLMLFLTATMANAQTTPLYGAPLSYLKDGASVGGYHLQVTHFGAEYPVDYPIYPVADIHNVTPTGSVAFDRSISEVFLSLDEYHVVSLVTTDDVLDNYKGLRSALWCVSLFEPPVPAQGKVATYHFINKQYSTLLSVDSGRWYNHGIGSSAFASYGNIRSQQDPWGGYKVVQDGFFANWAFSASVGATQALEQAPIRVEINGEPDYWMTFAVKNHGDPIELVKVHRNDMNPDAPSRFYRENLVFFRLVGAAPRVLTASDFNTMLGDRVLEDFVTLLFDPETEPASNNVLAQPLKASALSATSTVPYLDQYLRLQTSNNNYVYVADGSTAGNYYNAPGKHFPKLNLGSRNATQLGGGQADFRFVYYPAEDSLIINVRRIDHIDDGVNLDDGTRITTPGDGFYNMTILRHLIVKLQDLDPADGGRIITVYDAPAHTRIHFGLGDCRVIDDRVTVPPNLYVIKDHRGFYLDMPLDQGDFTPMWVNMNENEKPLKTPSSQWLITPTNSNSPYSPVRMTNREFNWVWIDFVQVYGSPHLFRGTVTVDNPLNTKYGHIEGIAQIYYDATASADGFFGSFKIVQDDPDVTATIRALGEGALTQDQWMRRYRTSKYLGYKYLSKDSINFFGYAFNYLHAYSPDYYLHTPPESSKDTVLYVNKAKNYFDLEIPYELSSAPENYGIGHGDDLLTLSSTRDIAKLVRYFYYFRQNDYWNFSFVDNYISMDRSGRYVFSNEAGIKVNPLKQAKFYLRFTYQPDGKSVLECNNAIPEYYTLLNRIDVSDFHYVNEVLGLNILDTLRLYDWSHEGYVESDGYGVVSAAVDDWNLFVTAQPKTGGSARLSTFAMSPVNEPLYRRFDVNALDCEAPAGAPRDYPRTLKISTVANYGVDYIYEDQYSANSYGLTCMNCPPFIPYSGNGIHFGGVENIFTRDASINAGQNLLNPGTYSTLHMEDPWHNYAIYVDTAFVNRQTGHIKPQYLLVVGPEFNEFKGCYLCGDLIEVQPWIYGRYLINATDSARLYPNNVHAQPGFRDQAYIWDSKWDRLAFVPAIHAGDTLFILKEVNYLDYIQTDDFGVKYLNFKALEKAIKDKAPGDIINLANNYHKDVVWSMRFYIQGDYEKFMLESETTNRSNTTGRMIAPMSGGWVKEQNGVLVISRGSYSDAILEAEKWNTECADMPREKAVGNEEIAAVKVIAGEGTVTILNAAGKQIVISNVLGQTVANTVLTSDNATIDAPKGVLVVAVEGENAVKAVVK